MEDKYLHFDHWHWLIRRYGVRVFCQVSENDHTYIKWIQNANLLNNLSWSNGFEIKASDQKISLSFKQIILLGVLSLG